MQTQVHLLILLHKCSFYEWALWFMDLRMRGRSTLHIDTLDFWKEHNLKMKMSHKLWYSRYTSHAESWNMLMVYLVFFLLVRKVRACNKNVMKRCVLAGVKWTNILYVIKWGGDDWNLSNCLLFLFFVLERLWEWRDNTIHTFTRRRGNALLYFSK